MGMRFRKSINLGGGFRVNLSKSGVGYSFGTKGFRYTKTAKGRNRTTASIPGTGISYVKESGGSKKRSNNQASSNTPNTATVNNNTYDTQIIENASATNIVSKGMEDMISAARTAIILHTIAIWTIIVTLFFSFAYPVFLVGTIVGLILEIIVKKRGIISLEYTIDDYQLPIVEERLKPFRQISQSTAIWKIIQSSKVIDKKYSSGANATINRKSVKVSKKSPFPFKTDIEVICIKDKKETILLLPDKLVVIQGTKIGALDYSDIEMDFKTTIFVESERVPKDATVVGKTWKYVNKSGGPDKRFKDNRQIPECKYGLMGMESTNGLNTIIMFSNPNVVEKCNN